MTASFVQRGTRGARGPDGQTSSGASATPGAAPAAHNTDVVWPPGDDDFPEGFMLSVEISATCERGDTKARRTLTSHMIIASASATATIDGQQNDASVNSLGWTGTASIAFSIYTTVGGTKKLRIQATGPAAAATCNWLISGAYIRSQTGLTS
jgi:hypothetical protein